MTAPAREAGTIQRVAIVGGGFSGAMLAARLAERSVASVLIDRTGVFGPGVAYSTGFDGHVLNVRSNRMSAVEGRPDDFVRWLEAHHPDHADPEGFTPRRLYGLYVEDRLARAEAAQPGLITRVVGEAVAVAGTAVRLSDGRRIEADAVVLATGNPAPGTADTLRADGPDQVIGDPWRPDALDIIGPEDDVIILGTGLTMVDIMLWLQARGWRGRATALSRRGLTPRAHGGRHDPPVSPGDALTSGPLSRRVAEARRLSAGDDWRGVMEGLRPITAAVWVAADPATRARFLRHLRPWWDVHRHRIADSVAGTMERLEADGRLVILAGRVRRAEQTGEGITLAWTPRRGGSPAPLTGRWLIDCTGPGHDPATAPLTGPLIGSGRARLDPLGLGLDLDAEGRVLDATGAPDRSLFVLGPPARAAFWETVAVPDIRKRIEGLVGTLAGARL
ncbi:MULTISPECIES: FAD/NAD(P)-binding protein [unclassified Brevundimonas]|uniref:FAD/NAD(P)-binding protein n=1 Tax=unclassified Brevundimonas TaxID=2622653 RepID=UPI0006FF2506|nr:MULTISPECIES: FAD/NAD(P)-binding protein [unclassified Brevundimonas]KQY88113.1 FAD-dependent oxidoreductase [Brevundimonas sp. Root1423]KRA28587.1 FAD-dependent oxidoreductase [Brevundimonas sp. Root608]